MKKLNISWRPVNTDELDKFDDYFDELKHSWHQKARDLQNRRWKKLNEKVN